MIQDMRQLALDFLYNELDGQGDAEAWYRSMRENEMGKLFPYLIEAARDSMAENYYVLYPDPNDESVAVMEQRVFKDGDGPKIPFVQSTGSQSPALGPIIKRSYVKAKGGGPSDKILDSTLASFAETGMQDEPWSDYFDYAQQVLSRPVLYAKFDETVHEGKPALHSAIEIIPETKTAFLSVLDRDDRLPGERPDYRVYLQGALAAEKYSTGKYPPIASQEDALTGEKTTVYPNSLAGAGLNLTNMDRIGAFSDLDDDNAWKRFSLSAANADLLFTFSFHMRGDFVGRVAGELALILPHLSIDQEQRQRFIADFKRYVDDIKSDSQLSNKERSLLRHIRNYPEAVLNITLLWANFGQKLENVTGIVTDVLPTRLSEISNVIEEVTRLETHVFPSETVETAEPDIAFNSLGALLHRPGGKKNKKSNESAKLFELKRDMAARTYHRQPVPIARFWDEISVTARAYLMDIAESGNTYGLLNEGSGKKGAYLTLAGWTKHLAQYIYFLRRLEVYPTMNDWHYEPEREELKPFFANTKDTAGLDTPEKVYAFLLGALFGKVMEVQGARGVNVGANALTWLKRLNMEGRDLPALYNKVREKLLTYNTESSAGVRAVIEELGRLGMQIGTPALNKTDASYYLLLGQSQTKTLIRSKPQPEKEPA